MITLLGSSPGLAGRPFATSRQTNDDERLEKLTKELLHKRQNFENSAVEEAVSDILKFNDEAAGEIKLLTSRLLAFLNDLKSRIEKTVQYDAIVPSLKEEWNGLIDDWTCDIRKVTRNLQERITYALKQCESKLVESRKFTETRINSVLSDLVTRINHLTIQNERTYAETECHLKLLFEEILRKWLILFSHEICRRDSLETTKINEPAVDTQSKSEQQLKKIFDLVDGILPSLDDFDVDFTRLWIFDFYINHLKICKRHAKMNFKEALLGVKSQLEEPKQMPEDPDMDERSQALWLEIVDILRAQNADLDNYVKQSTYAWNKFIKRLHCAEATANIAIDKLRSRILNTAVRSEAHMSILLDALREGSSVAQMDRVLSQISNEIESMISKILSVRKDEDRIIEQLITACFIAIDIFSSQLALLEEPKPNGHTIGKDCKAMDDDNQIEITNRKLVVMKYCVFSAQSWIQGFKETVAMLEGQLPKFLAMFSKNLVLMYQGDCEYWVMLQLQKLFDRKQRIKEAIYEPRLKELQEHEVAQKNITAKIESLSQEAEMKVDATKERLVANNDELIMFLEETKTNSLEDTLEKKWNNIKKRSAIEKLEEKRVKLVHQAKLDVEKIFKTLEESCITYLSSLRLFHEGGNYSSDECNMAVKKYSKINADLLKTCDGLLKKLDKILTSTRDAFRMRFAKIVYPKATEAEISKAAERSANERLQILFNRLKEMIKIETYKAAKSLTALKEAGNEIKQASNLTEWLRFVLEVYAASTYFAPPTESVPMELLKAEGKRKSRRGALNRKSKQFLNIGEKCDSSKRSVASSHSLIYRSGNFPDEDNYLYNTKKLMNKTYPKIKSVLIAAYNHYHLTKSHYSHQKSAATVILKHYNLQCESVWTFLLKDYLDILHRLYSEIIAYISLSKDRHFYDMANRAMKLRHEHKSKLDQLNVKGVKESIDNRLKPYHGYPLNKHLLQSLLILVVQYCKEHLQARKTVNDTFKDDLKELAVLNREKTQDLIRDSREMIVTILSHTGINEFMNSIHQSFRNISSTIVDTPKIELPLPKKQSIGRRSASKPVDVMEFTYLHDFEFMKFPSYINDILNTVKAIQRETEWFSDELDEEEDDSFIPENDAGYPEIEPPLLKKFLREIEKMVEEFEQSAIGNLRTAKAEFDSISSELVRWKAEWVSNIKEVNKLYLIDPILDAPPQKLALDPATALRCNEITDT
ncbi:Hypothetical protein NTJ_05773 [Nesidiocoris tenuis]|uniref:Dynein heavy chain tail domain-containing protein n=1 Tax=Nesidiocoris tenuis TaxID=355587 RepID=A0ABN7ALZ5_9HEMI|nr:Hypothetical protein NTJ_05773 [Nesidiocoris tenuis]